MIRAGLVGISALSLSWSAIAQGTPQVPPDDPPVECGACPEAAHHNDAAAAAPARLSVLDWTSFALGSLTLLSVALSSRRRREATGLLLGLVIFGASSLDLLYVPAANRVRAGNGPQDFLPIFSSASRLGAAASLALGAGLLLLHRRRLVPRFWLVSMGAGALVLLAFAATDLAPALIARLSILWPGLPLDTLPLAAWALAGGLLHWVTRRAPADGFSQFVTLSTLPQVGSHLYLALGRSGSLPGLLKLLAYLIPAAAGLTLLRSRRAPASTPVRGSPDERSAEEQLRSKEIQLRQLTENIREVFWMSSPDKSVMYYVSPAYESIFGRSCESLYQNPRSFLDPIHPDDRSRIAATLSRQASGDFDEEYRIVRPDGSIRWIWARAFPVRNESGDTYRIAGLSEDITARRRAADERETIRLISEFLLASPSLEAVFRKIPRLISERFDFPIVAIVLYDEPAASMVFVGWAGAQFTEPLRVPVDATISGRVVRTGKAFLERDVSRFGDNLHPSLREIPSNLICCLPMKLGERVLGALTLSAERERQIEPETMESLQLIADDLAQAVERKKAEEALRKSEARNRAMVEAIPDLIFRLDRKGVFLDYNAPEELLARPPAEFLGRHLADVLPEIAGEADRALGRALATGKMQNFEYRLEAPSGWRDFEARLVPIGEDEALAIVRDITERKRLEREILEVSGREQLRIGQDLHDGLGQQLLGIAMMSRALEKTLAVKSLEESAAAKTITDLIQESVMQAKSLARGLYPVELERNGIVAALRELAGQIESLFSISCLFRYAARLRIPEGPAALHLYRIAQEAVGNAVKHAKPREIVISLAKDRGAVTLTVCDDGRGMPREAEPGRGMGLNIMRYRARMIDASLDIRPRAEGGTVVTCSLRNPNSPQQKGKKYAQ